MRHPGTPAPLNYRRLSAFSAACPGCGRTLLGLLAALSASLPAVFAAVTVVVLVSLFPATTKAQGDPEEPCPGGGYNPTPVAVAVTAVPIVVASTTADYFVLYVRHTVDGSEVEFPVLVKRGEVDTTTLAENVAALPKERYRVEKYLIADPADVDGDCIDDLTELTNLGSQNPVNPAAGIALTDGAVAIPDEETFTALSEVFASRSGGWTHVVKFFLGDTDTDRPLVYFMNTSKHLIHQSFIDAVGPELGRHTSGKLTYHPELVAPDGSQGLYYFSLNNLILPAFSHAERSYTQLAASMRLLDDNLAVYIPNRRLSRVQSDLQFFRASRMHLVFDEDLFSETYFQALNPGEGYGRLRALEPDERPHPRDIVLYEALPNELPRVAGIISTVPQTPLSHVNLRAVQDGVPNAFIRGALDEDEIDDLIGSYVRYTVTETGWDIRAATRAQVDAHYTSSRPTGEQTPQRDLSVTTITPLGEIGFEDWTAFGVKAANVAVLGMLGFPTGTVPTGFAIPFYFYDKFMTDSGLYDDIKDMLAASDFQTDFDTQESELKKLRKAIKDAETPQWIIDALTAMHATYPEGQSLRYRSSTNNEDLPGFNGAGLYDSKTQHPDETDEDGIDKSLKQVYASLWNFRAFTERDFNRIDHLAAKMGVLVHPNYSDELANGVAVSFDPIRGLDGDYYVNTQVGEDLVTNPEPHSVPEELLLSRDTGRYIILYFSNLVEPGELLLSDAQVRQLRDHLTVIHERFAVLYNPAPDEPFAMEIEFKITSDNVLAIKQARPWVFSGGGGSGGGNTGGGGAAVESITSSATHPTKDGFTVTITFSELVMGLEASEITVTNGTGSNFAGAGAIYTLEITPNTGIEDDLTVTVTAGAVVDGVNKGNLEASAAFSVDTKAPVVSTVAITSNPGPDATYAPGEAIEVTVTFSETVTVDTTNGTPDLGLTLGAQTKLAAYGRGSNSETLVFAYPVVSDDLATGGVSIATGSIDRNGGTIRDGVNNDAVLDHEALAPQAGHKVDGVKPELAAGGGAVADGAALTLSYNELLDGGSTPEMDDFTVAGGDRARTVTRIVVRGASVELTLDVGVGHGEAGIQVSYTPGMNPIRDAVGNEAEGLSRVPVTNETQDTTAPKVSSLTISSTSGADQTYAVEDEIEVTVRFSETVEVEGTPRLTLKVGSRNRTASYRGSTDTDTLTFVYEVADGDEDTDGVSIDAGRIALNGGKINDEADNPAELIHEAVATQVAHKVDGIRPSLLSAAVDGASLTLTYMESLDGGSRPATGDFTVEVDGAGRSVTEVSVSGSVVTLTLSTAVEHEDTGIRVSYTPGTNPIRDAVGNDARGLSNQAVTNTTGAPNTAPEITTVGPFTVRENQALVSRLAARDDDSGDEVTGWSIIGGADQSQFSITSDTGDLSFQEAPDYESPTDVMSGDPPSGAGDNEYVVTVEVRSGAGARELEAEQTFTVRVTDEREPPGIPEAPAFSGAAADSLTVHWRDPENTGPAITDYGVRYRKKGPGRFIDAQHMGPGLSLTLDDLEPGTAYEVQVQATNDEGTSDWSDPGEGMTVTPLTVEMMGGTEPPVEGPFTVRFSFSETVVGFTRTDITTQQEPACTDSANNPISCNPTIAALQTTDDRIFTTTVTPRTERVAHNYTLTLTVSGGAVRSSVGNKRNEEAMLGGRVAPPGVTVPISEIGLTASGLDRAGRLNWNRPANDGGSPIIRYEYRYAPVGEVWNDWENVGAGAAGVTVGNLVNGLEYVFEVRAVNALGKGPVETAAATPVLRTGPPPPPPPPPGPRETVPDAPTNLLADGGNEQVALSWEAPENDGGFAITDYEVRINGRGSWISIGSTHTTHTVTGLTNGTAYVFQVRAVNAAGSSPYSNRAEATPGVGALDFAHFANGAGIISDLVFVNVATHPIRPVLYFYDKEGHSIAAESVVDLTEDLEVTEDGALSIRTEMEPLGELTISTHGRGEVMSGSVQVAADGPIGGVLRFDLPGIGVAGVGASQPVRDALFPARRQAGGIATAAAIRNLGEEALVVSCRLMSGGIVLEAVEISLAANGQEARYIEELFTGTDTSDFVGSVRCTAPGLFTGIAVELDDSNRIFTTLPVVPVARTGGRGQEAGLDFAHFANGNGTTSDLVFVNVSPRPSGPGPTPYHTAVSPSRPALYFYDQEGHLMDPASVVDLTGDLEITGDGALSIQTEMEPLGELTISTHGRGELVSGSVTVVSEGPIGGVLRYALPGIGVTGVGSSPPVQDALFPVRQEGGLATAAAIRNLTESDLVVTCRLMKDGAVLEEAEIPLEANGQEARYIEELFPTTDTSNFVGSVRCTAPGEGLFTGVAVELDPGNRIFTTLPVVPVPERTDRE